MLNNWKIQTIVLTIGIIFTAIASSFGIVAHYSAYTFEGILVTILLPVISYAVILGVLAAIISLIISLIKRNIRSNIKRYWLISFAILFFISGSLDLVSKSYRAFVIDPQIEKIMLDEELMKKLFEED